MSDRFLDRPWFSESRGADERSRMREGGIDGAPEDSPKRVAADVHVVDVHMDVHASGRAAGDIRTSESPVEGQQSEGAADVESPAGAIQDLLLGDAFRLNAAHPYGTPASVSYAFLEAVPSYYRLSDWAHDSFRPFSLQQQDMTRGALAMIESYSNLTFVETAVTEAAITFGIADLPSGWAGYSFYPVGTAINRKPGDVWIDTAAAGVTLTPGAGPYKSLIHELGHAIGLDHPGALPAVENSRMYTVMSYSRHPYASGEPQTHMLYDIGAVQHLYGANASHAAGDTVYDYAVLGNRIQTLWDGGGGDTLDLSAAPFSVRLDLSQGAFSTVAGSGRDNLAIAYGATIENAFGGASDDVVLGNTANNRLGGGPGNDVLTGGGGDDVFGFAPGWGRDAITDFTRDADLLDLRDTGLAFTDLRILASDNGILVAHNADRIALSGIDDLAESDFLFSQTLLLA